MRLRHITAPIAAALIVVLGACSSGESSDSSPEDTAAPTTTANGGDSAATKADVEFAQGMLAHHEQAIEMSEIAADPNVGASAAVVEFAKRIRAAQEPEVEQMTAWLTTAGEPLTMDMSDGHDMSAMPGMMDSMQMDMLASAKGAAFDDMWVEMMIEHHEGAVVQAKELLTKGSSAELKALANEIIRVQQAEITELRELLKQ